jgi:hypothetical protein
VVSADGWAKLAKQTVAPLPRFRTLVEAPVTTIAASVYARGTGVGWEDGGVDKVEDVIRRHGAGVEWNPFVVDALASQRSVVGDGRASMSLLWNSSGMGDVLQGVVDKAAVMYEAGAYLHWYESYGCDEGVFEEAFEVVQGMIDAYTYYSE